MKIHNVEQGGNEWRLLRAGCVTASRCDAILSPLFKARDSKGVETFAAKLLAERWIGGPLPEDEVYAAPVEFGAILEHECKPAYTFITGEKVETVGFITDDSGRIGASPDGLIGNDAGIEIKCPEHTNHVKWLLSNKIPDDYIVQCHFGMYVSGRSRWVFMSYRRNMPPFITEVRRDEKIQAAIKDAVDAFLVRLDAGWARLVELNGGPPERPKTVDALRREETEIIP